jgi:hypothetical protein
MMLASTTITVVTHGGYRSVERDSAASTPAGAVKYLVQRRPAGLVDQPETEVLLKGLVGCGSASAQHSMCLSGYIFDLHTRHGAIMALKAPQCKYAVKYGEVAAPPPTYRQ